MRSTDERARRTHLPRHHAVDLRLSLVRDGAVEPLRRSAATIADELARREIVDAAKAVHGRRGGFLISGGDPLRHSAAWEVLAELARLRPDNFGVCSAGDGVTTEVAQRLHSIGVQRVQIPFHCARQDAHDWLVGRPGALRTAHRAIRACREADLAVTADIVLTRPTMRQLAETIEVLARLGVRTVNIRRLKAEEADGPQFVPLSPRLGLLRESLEEAAAAALHRQVRLRLRGLPLCVAPRLRPLCAAPDSEVWVQPDGSVHASDAVSLGCPTCPGAPQCAGAPADYVARFGWEEFIDPTTVAPRVAESVRDQQRHEGAAPLTFTWRGPRRVRCDACAETPGEASNLQLGYEATRVVRARLVEAARYRPSVVRLVGADLLAHPQGALLIYDALRLFRRVEVAAEGSPIVDWTDLDLRRLKDLARIDVALYGPDAATHDAHCGVLGAFAAMLRGVDRLQSQTTIPVGAYAVLHDARLVPAFAEAWNRGDLPGEPRFRLSSRGGSLDELAESARALPAGPAQTALFAVLPRCGTTAAHTDAAPGTSRRVAGPLRVHAGRTTAYQPSGSDPLGAFETCSEEAESCAASGCPGTAVGWHSTARAQRWSGSN